MTGFWKSDHQKAFEKLYFNNFSRLCRAVYRFVRDSDVVRDIVQEAFIGYWKKGELTNSLETPEAYLMRSSINGALNYLKETGRRTARENTYANETGKGVSLSPTPLENLEEDETSSHIQSAIDNLPPVCREVFLLSRYEQMRYKEIASLLHISVNTVEKHIGHALKILRNALNR